MIQLTIVRKRAIKRPNAGFGMLWLIETIVLIKRDARPVTVIQPATIPAIEHATITVIQLLPPAERDS